MTTPNATFWSGETLSERLDGLIEPFAPERVDCAAYTLSVGSEVFVSPSDQAVEPHEATVRQLDPEEAFAIPPGQFAFLLTEEIVGVPDDALAFISIRATIKFRGLINVSGFHVDPGYHGQLTFAVFNAGPTSVHLRQGDKIFLIWYASLDRRTNCKKKGNIRKGIDTKLLTGVGGELQSFASLSKKINDVNSALDDRMNKIERTQVILRTLCTVAVTLLISLLVT